MGRDGSGAACPLQAEERLAAMRDRIEGARLKIEGLALLGDLLAEQLQACENKVRQGGARVAGDPLDRAVAESGLLCGRSQCVPTDCPEAHCATVLEQAFDRLAERVAALHEDMEAARQGRPILKRRKRRGPPPLAARPSYETSLSSRAPTA